MNKSHPAGWYTTKIASIRTDDSHGPGQRSRAASCKTRINANTKVEQVLSFFFEFAIRVDINELRPSQQLNQI